MEVHHHGHVHEKKKWKEYLFQFFMLFLAVFCGFLAEYQLEHKIEDDREKQFISSLVYDLKDDQVTLDVQINKHKLSVNLLDSMFWMISDPAHIRENGDAIYYIGRLAPRISTFAQNNKTFDQLRNSGGFRLIHRQETANRIMAYYNMLPLLRKLEDEFSLEFTEYKRLAAKIFDPVVFRQQENEAGISRSTYNPALRTYDPEILKEFGIKIVYLNGTRRVLLPIEENLKANGKELISYLEKEYDLD